MRCRHAFDYFVVFAEMRTGSNFLEANLNAFDGLACHGEAFNPHFIGYPNRSEILGVTQADARCRSRCGCSTQDPAAEGRRAGRFPVLSTTTIRACWTRALADPRCAKIILTRNPVDSYVSRKIAAATGQWKLTNVKHAKSARRSRFDAGRVRAASRGAAGVSAEASCRRCRTAGRRRSTSTMRICTISR